MARRMAANSHRVAANRTTGLEEESSLEGAMNDVGRRWLNDRTGSTQPSESDRALRRPAFCRAFSDCDTSRVPIAGSTGSTSDSEDRTHGESRYRYAELLPTNR